MKLLGKKGETGAKQIILSVIGVVIAISLVPIIVTSVSQVTPNLSGAALILIGLVTFIFVAGILVIMIKKMLS